MGEYPAPGRAPAEHLWHRSGKAGRVLPQARRPAAHPAAKPLPFEFEAFRGLVDEAVLNAAARRANALGVGGDEVLRAHGILGSDRITSSIANHLGLPVDQLNEDVAPPTPGILKAAQTGVLARNGAAGPRLTIAPRGLTIRDLAQRIAERPEIAGYLAIASPERVSLFVQTQGVEELAVEAVHGLRRRRPDMSAATANARSFLLWLMPPAMLAGLIGYFYPQVSLIVLQLLLAFMFLAWMGLRLGSCLVRADPTPLRRVPERALPVYTVIVALYDEARVLPKLVAALNRLDYPREKLDIKFVLEPDDVATWKAVDEFGLPPHFEIVRVPMLGPQTKPRALAAALPFARGEFVAVYDAEDEPEPGQLREALSAFRRDGGTLACVQARLAIDNAADGWLTRQFAAEYAGLFEVFLPALAKWRLPLPLGGTSNHFHATVLRRLGGWDPYNVTEDADLGMRLARLGYRTGVIGSRTWEEAPAHHGAWLRQRTRWLKGWMQTWLVHMRAPRRLLRELGWRNFTAFQLLMGGTVLASLVHPIFLAIIVNDIFDGTFLSLGDTSAETARKLLAIFTLTAGYLGSAALGLAGLRRRRLRGAWVLATIPVYWFLLSAAAWRALWQLFIAPHRWEKTAHGLARSSLRPRRRPVRDTGAGRLRPLRGFYSD